MNPFDLLFDLLLILFPLSFFWDVFTPCLLFAMDSHTLQSPKPQPSPSTIRCLATSSRASHLKLTFTGNKFEQRTNTNRSYCCVTYCILHGLYFTYYTLHIHVHRYIIHCIHSMLSTVYHISHIIYIYHHMYIYIPVFVKISSYICTCMYINAP